MKNIAITIYFLGMLGAIVIGARFFETDATAKILLNPIFIISLILSTVGCILWWKAAREEKSANAKLDHASDSLMAKEPKVLITETMDKVIELADSYQALDKDIICERLENISETYIHAIVDKKDDFMMTYGTAKGSEIFIKLSYSERMLNRAYSYSADGYAHELNEIFPLIVENYKESIEMLG